MSREYLSDRVWRDPEGTNYIMFDVTEEVGEQQKVIVDGTELLPKDEYHVTLVPASKLSEDMKVIDDTVSAVRLFLHDNPNALTFKALGSERYICKKKSEVTIIAPATIVGIDSLREIIQYRVPNYAPAFPHVTLLKSANSQYGIGVNSVNDLNTYCRKIT